MSKSTRFNVGKHFDDFIRVQVQAGRYGSPSDVVRQGLRLLEEHEQQVQALRQALTDGENSGDAGPLDREKIRASAKRKAQAFDAP